MINNTRGSGDILGTRMLRIRTDRIPDAMKGALGDLPPATSTRVGLLRDELHSWTFGNVRRIEEAYRKMYPRAADRSDEITAPLRVMASLAGDQELGSKLEVGLIRQSRPALQMEDPQQVVLEALKNLVAQGYDTVSPTHVTLEARKLVDQSGASSARRTPEWLKPGRVGRMLHGLDVLYEEHGGPKRIRLFGMNLRFFRIRDAHLTIIKEEFEKRGTVISPSTRRPTDFCRDCGSCPYNVYECEIMRTRRDIRELSVSLT